MWQYTGQLVATACSRAHLQTYVSEWPVNPVSSGDPSLIEVFRAILDKVPNRNML